MAQVVELLPSKWETLTLNPSILPPPEKVWFAFPFLSADEIPGAFN